ALPSRAARNRRSRHSSHPPSRGDLLGAPLAGALSAGGSSPRTKLATTVRSGLKRRGVLPLPADFKTTVAASVVCTPGCCRPPWGQHFGRRIGSLICAPPPLRSPARSRHAR